MIFFTLLKLFFSGCVGRVVSKRNIGTAISYKCKIAFAFEKINHPARVNYSFRRVFDGLTNAAFMAWKLAVANAMAMQAIEDMTKGPAPTDTR